MATVYRYQATFRHKKTKAEFREYTQAYSVMDAVMQCILTAASRGVDNNEYELVSVGPHPDELIDITHRIELALMQK